MLDSFSQQVSQSQWLYSDGWSFRKELDAGVPKTRILSFGVALVFNTRNPWNLLKFFYKLHCVHWWDSMLRKSNVTTALQSVFYPADTYKSYLDFTSSNDGCLHWCQHRNYDSPSYESDRRTRCLSNRWMQFGSMRWFTYWILSQKPEPLSQSRFFFKSLSEALEDLVEPTVLGLPSHRHLASHPKGLLQRTEKLPNSLGYWRPHASYVVKRESQWGNQSSYAKPMGGAVLTAQFSFSVLRVSES